MEKGFIGRKRCETVKSPKLMPSLIFSKVGQWTRFEFLQGQFWASGLMFNTPVLEDDLMFHCSPFNTWFKIKKYQSCGDTRGKVKESAVNILKNINSSIKFYGNAFKQLLRYLSLDYLLWASQPIHITVIPFAVIYSPCSHLIHVSLYREHIHYVSSGIVEDFCFPTQLVLCTDLVLH